MKNWPFGVFLVLAPIILGIWLFELFQPFTPQLQQLYAEAGAASNAIGYPTGVIGFLSAAVAQIIVCGGVFLYAIGLITTTPLTGRAAYWAAATIVSLLLSAPFVYFAVAGNAALAASYGVVKAFLSTSAASDWVAPMAQVPLVGVAQSIDVSRLSIALIGCGFVAALGVGFTATAARAQVAAARDGRDIDYGGAQVSERLRLCFYLLAAVFGASILLLSAFFNVPAELYAAATEMAGAPFAADDAASAYAVAREATARTGDPVLFAMRRLASEMILFWGVVFTFANIVAVALPFFMLHFGVAESGGGFDGEVYEGANPGFNYTFEQLTGGLQFRQIVERLLLIASPLVLAEASSVANFVGSMFN